MNNKIPGVFLCADISDKSFEEQGAESNRTRINMCIAQIEKEPYCYDSFELTQYISNLSWLIRTVPNTL